MITATISSKNQITIPKLLLESLNIKSGDRVLVGEKNKKIFLEPVRGNLVDRLAGSVVVAPEKRGVPFRRVIAETRKMVAKRLAENN